MDVRLSARWFGVFGSADPFRELRQLAIALRDEGVTQIEVYFLFATFQVETSGHDPKYDAIADTMDLIWGRTRVGDIFHTELTEEQVRAGREEYWGR